jgi:hypothetical protein
MKKFLLFFTGVLFFASTGAQTDSLKWVKEIDEQVWKPFVEHFVSGNKAGFRAVHSKNITRVEIDRGIVQDYEKYFPADTSSNPAWKNVKRQFELRFDKRISNGTKAWESGYYKGTVMQEGKQPRSYYGRFFAVLQKENGVWKILVDADTGKDANEDNFNKASTIQ